MIPKIIHCCWVGGSPMSAETKKYIDSWRRMNPDFEIKVWTEENFDFSKNLYARQAYENRKWAFVSDYVRLKVLYDFGGVYMDTDVEAVRPFGEMLNNKAFTGFERNEILVTGTMAAEKHNPWIKLHLDDYDERSFVLPDGGLDLTTNAVAITSISKANYPVQLNNQYQNLGDVTFYPFDWLCAKDYESGKIKRTKNTVTIHHFKGSWKTPKQKFLLFLNRVIGDKMMGRFVAVKRLLRGTR